MCLILDAAQNNHLVHAGGIRDCHRSFVSHSRRNTAQVKNIINLYFFFTKIK